ncbi:MAG: lipoate--protein ligase [Clostridia bacterium]|nr:lipoate--protein ligase [Clostridia bacterium]
MLTYLESSSTDPHFNLALEQYVFDCLPRDREYFMLWRNDNAIIVGKHQNTAAEVNAAYVREHGIRVVRRLSGGGAVYHDLANLNFTFIMDTNEGASLDLKLFCAPVAKALNRMGVPAEVNGRNDITVDGMKFSGNAQYVKEGRVMHHGTILFDSDLSVVSQALVVSAEKLESKGVQSVRSRVTNLRPFFPEGVTLADFKQQLLSAMFEENTMARHDFTAEDLKAVEALRDSRYATWEWNWGASPKSTVYKRRRFEGCGTVEVFLDTDKGRVTGLTFRGDYFGADDADALTARLVGIPLEASALRAAMDTVDIARYFTGLDLESFLRLLLD